MAVFSNQVSKFLKAYQCPCELQHALGCGCGSGKNFLRVGVSSGCRTELLGGQWMGEPRGTGGKLGPRPHAWLLVSAGWGLEASFAAC